MGVFDEAAAIAAGRRGKVPRTYERIKESLARVAQQGLIHPMDQLSIERLRRFADTLRT